MFVSIYVWWKFTPAKFKFAMQEPKQENFKKYRALIDFISSIVAHTGLDGLRDLHTRSNRKSFLAGAYPASNQIMSFIPGCHKGHTMPGKHKPPY